MLDDEKPSEDPLGPRAQPTPRRLPHTSALGRGPGGMTPDENR